MSNRTLLQPKEILISLAAFVIIIAGIKSSQVILAPFLLAVFIAVIAAPSLFWLEKIGINRFFAFIIATAFVVGILTIMLIIIIGALNDFAHKLPELNNKFMDLMIKASLFFDDFGIVFDPQKIPREMQPSYLISTAGVFIKSASKILSSSFLIFLMVAFILFETTSLGTKMRIIMGRNTEESIAAKHSLEILKRYLFIKTLASSATGILIGIGLSVLGVDNALLWGMLAFLLNFIPTIGSIIAAIPPIVMTFIEYDLGIVGGVTAIYLSINIMIGNIIEPRFLGYDLGLSPLVVLLSLLFWGWVLGPIGMFLAVPLTMSIKIALGLSPKTRWISIILSHSGTKKKKKLFSK